MNGCMERQEKKMRQDNITNEDVKVKLSGFTTCIACRHEHGHEYRPRGRGGEKQTDTLTLTWRGTVMCADRSGHMMWTILKTCQIHTGAAERHGITHDGTIYHHSIPYNLE